MPTYEYECDNCSHGFEKFQSITAGSLRKCPECGKLKLRRLIGTGAALIFKGSGFYQTDYRSENYKSGAEADKKAKETAKETAKSEKSGSKKSDSASSPTKSKSKAKD